MRARVFWHTSVPLFAGLLVGCGGGGGSGYSAPPPAAAPTVSFSAPSATSINFGQAVKLNWSSTNATSCSATSSSDIGGAFNGSQATSGPATVAPKGAGSVSFTLTCTGTGGSATATSATITVNQSILSILATKPIVEVGSTVDPANGDGNPYGLAIAPASSGPITAGDLIVCNFSNSTDGDEGDGTTIVGLHPTPGAGTEQKAYRIAQSALLTGCNALTVLPDDSISAAAYVPSLNPLVTAGGAVNNPFQADKLGNPWGEAYVAASGSNSAYGSGGSSPAVLYISNVSGGTIDRIVLNGDAQSGFTEIAKGFCGYGSPGAIFAPSGLTYDPSIDTLYIVDTSSYSVVAFANVSAISTDGIVVNGQCPTDPTTSPPPTPQPTFSGPSASSARVIANGSPLFTPLSAALLADGDLIVTNADINITSQSPNQAFEISPVLPGGFVGQPLQLDTSGKPGALFGIVATTDSQGHQIIYFNDDNTNTVESVSE